MKLMQKIRPLAFFPPFILLIILAFYSLTAGMKNEEKTVEVMSRECKINCVGPPQRA